MSKKQGIIIFFDEKRRRDMINEKRSNEYKSFSDALSVPDWGINQIEIALLSFSSSTIDFIAIATKGNRVATAKSRVEFTNILNLNSIRIDDIIQNIDSNIKRYFIKSSQGIGGKIPEKTWHNLLEIIKKLRPELKDEIERITTLKEISKYILTGDNVEIILQEREALGAALDIFCGNNELRKKTLSNWAPKKDQISEINETLGTATLTGKSNFMSGIGPSFFKEESSLQHDLFGWNGISPIHEIGTSIFEKGERKLHVIYANRNALESTLGVDLIYYNEFHKSFILVQYKLMKQGNTEFIYRPDKQLEKELDSA